jgi:NitT/TauT family transport system substrate-binding protein
MTRLVTRILAAVLLAVLAAGGVGAQDKAPRKVVFAITTKDVSVGHAAHSSLPQALGYWKAEGLDVEVASIEGSAAGLQQLGAGAIQIVSIGPEEIVLGREKGVRIRGYYVQARETIYRVIVPADSAIRDAAGFKGKTLGVPSLASGSVPYSKAWLAAAGLNPDADVKYLAVGVGAPGRLALQQKQVDGLALWDTLQASIENSGLAVRRLDQPFARQVIGQTIAARDDFIAENAAVLVGFARGVAKATVFGLANPEAAVRIHWKTYPQTRPTTGDEAQNLKDAIHVFNARFALQQVDGRDDRRFGAATARQWQALQNIFKEQKLIAGAVSVADLYTGALVDQINAFDRDAIVRQAREYRAP